MMHIGAEERAGWYGTLERRLIRVRAEERAGADDLGMSIWSTLAT